MLYGAPLPCSDTGVSFVKVRVVAGSIQTSSPTVYHIVCFCCVLLQLFLSSMTNVWFRTGCLHLRLVMLLVTTFVELRVVAGRSRTRLGSSQADTLRTYRVVAERLCRRMASVNQTRPRYVYQPYGAGFFF